jgi:hypothetical protein
MSRKRKNGGKFLKAILTTVAAPLSRLRTVESSTFKRFAAASAWMAGVAGFVALWTFGVPKLQAFASIRESVPSHEITIRFVDQPAWVRESLANHLLRTASMQLGDNALDRDALVAVREALMGTGWFDAIEQVRRSSRDTIEIHARFVQPYTLVRDKSGHHLVDMSGKLLPKSYGPSDDLPVMVDSRTGQTLPMIAISGAYFSRPAVGAIWEGADVSAALKLVRLLDEQPWRHQVAEVDVSTVMSDGMIRLRTLTSSVILWGGPPGEEAALELPAQAKLRRLSLLYQNHGRIDGGRTGELDITCEKLAGAR